MNINNWHNNNNNNNNSITKLPFGRVDWSLSAHLVALQSPESYTSIDYITRSELNVAN